MEELFRVNKLLSEYGFCSRRKGDKLLVEGRVTSDGRVLKLGDKLSKEASLEVDGTSVKKEEKRVILAFNKPRGIECTANEEIEDNLISYLKYDKRLLYIGRLDKDSEGLLLLTNEGDLINKIMRAGNYHEKEYIVEVNKPITSEFIKNMSSGVDILDTRTRPCRVVKIDEKHFRIILTQGLNRQIRRMCQVFDYKVRSLKRIRVMNIELGDLKVGEYRELSLCEENELRKALTTSYNTFGEGK